MKTLKQKLRKLTKIQYKILKDFCHYSNSLYNFSLYVCKSYYEQTGKYIGYSQLWQEVKTNENAKLLPAQISRQTVMLVDKNFRSFFALLKRKQKGEYSAEVRTPNFRKKGDVFLLTCPLPGFSIKDKNVSIYSSSLYKKLNGKQKLNIPFTFNIQGKVKQIIIKPFDQGKAFQIYYQYEEDKIELPYTESSRILGLDLGINNFVTGVCYPSGHSFIVNGKPLKSYNRWYNKTKARLQSELEIKQHKKWSHRLSKITQKRDWFVDNYFNQIVNVIVKKCISKQIGTVVLGYNATWKQGINLGKKNNQNFSYIPYLRFIQKLTFKLESLGIKLIVQEESYTSKCSFLDKEEIKKHETYLGKRIKRGLFQTSNGKFVNSDVNGAANILKKVIGNSIYDSNLIVGLTLNPIKIQILIKNL